MGREIDADRWVFVADVHLRPEVPDRTERFFAFLERQVGSARAVFILGDLFDLWVSPSQIRHAHYRPIVSRLEALVRRSLPLVFVQGNRDFLVDRRFEGETGVRVHEDPLEADLAGSRILLTHGDLLCSADRSYQRTRRILRSPTCRALSRLLPLRITFTLAGAIRRYSDWVVPRKGRVVLEPTEDAVRVFFDRGFATIVCGHLHRPGIREFEFEGGRCRLVCVGDWEESGSFAEFDGLEFRILDAEGRPIGQGSPSEANAAAPEPGVEIVTIDGPSGAGKSTVARRLAERLGWTYLDTGAMYRAVTWKVLQLGVSAGDPEAVARVAWNLDLAWTPEGRLLADGTDVTDAIREGDVTATVSEVSAHPGVRRAMVRLQREAARAGRLVVEGRDIGSVVFPHARFRFYLDAAPSERARRRAVELRGRGGKVRDDDVLADLERRDRFDSSRPDSPLRFEAGMIYVDSTGLGIDEVVDRLVEKVLES